MRKNETQEKICGQRWARMLPIYQAAAYAGMTFDKFVMAFPDLILDWHGVNRVDKNALDARITEEINRATAGAAAE